MVDALAPPGRSSGTASRSRVPRGPARAPVLAAASTTVLLVDADVRSRASVVRALLDCGFHLAQRASESEALAALTQGHYPVVILAGRVAQPRLLVAVRAASPGAFVLAAPDPGVDAEELIAAGVDDVLDPRLPPALVTARLALVARAVQVANERVTGGRLHDLENAVEDLQDILENATDIVFTHDLSGRMTYINRAAEEVMGYSRAEALRMNIRDLIHPGDVARAQAMTTAKLGGAHSTRYEIRLRKRDGRDFAVEVSTRLITRAGQVTGVCGIARDVSESRRLQGELRARAEMLRQVDAAVVATGGAGCVTYWNDKAAALLGWSAGDAAGHSVRDLFVPPDDPRWPAGVPAIDGDGAGGEYEGEVLVRRRDGSCFPAHLSSAPLHDPAGEPYGVAMVLVDLTARKAMEWALRESEQRYQELFDRAPDMHFVVREDGTVASVNASGAAALGYEASELEGQPVWTVVHPEDRPHVEAQLALLLRSGESAEELEFRKVRKDGSVIWVRERIQPVTREGGGATELHIICRDVTERHAFERALRASEEGFRLLFAANPQPMFVYDCGDRRFLEVNDAAIRQYGYTRETFLTLNTGDVCETVDQALAEAGAALEQTHRTASGRTFPAAVRAHLFRFHGHEACLVIAEDVSDRKRARDALRTAEQYLHTVVSSAQVFILAATSEGTVALSEGAGLARMGLAQAEVVGRSIEELFHDAPALPAALARVVAGESQSLELTHAGVTFDTRLDPIRDPDDDVVVGVIAVGTDVTERNQAEEARRVAQSRLSTLTAAAPVVLWAVDADGTYTLAEGRGLQTLGLEPSALLGKNVFHERRNVPAHLANIRRALAGESVVCTLPDGDLVFESHYDPVYDDCGSVAGVVGVSLDITERERASEAQRMAEERFRVVARHAPLILWAIDTDGILTLVEGRDLQRLDAEPGANVGKNIFSRKEAAPALLEAVRRCLETGDEFTLATDYRGFAFEHQCAPLRDPAGRIAGMVGVTLDITERRRTEDTFFQAQKLESLGILAGGVAHDFNNLLVGILGNAGLALAELPPASPARPTIEDIQVAGKRAAELARQMLAYSGKGRFVIEHVNLNGIVEEMNQLLRASISKNVAIGYDVAPFLPAVEGDATQLRQVIMNLVVNASDAIGSQAGTVDVRTRVVRAARGDFAGAYLAPDLPSGDYVVVEVSDSGAGMDAETRARVFDPFFTTKFAGRGLGLAAVLGIVRGHRGAIFVSSEPGRGSTFRLMFPAAGLLPEQPGGSGFESGGWRGTGTVLVVDDEDTVRAVTARALRSVGFEVLTAPDGRAGVECYREHAGEIVCVLLDMTMPVWNGEEALRALREADPGVRVILMSGYSEQEALARFAGQGLAAFIEKPFELDRLVAVFRRVLEGEGEGAAK